MKTFCNTFTDLCSAIAALLHMTGSPYNDPAREAVQDYRVGSSASLRQVIHYGQIVASGVFKQYDWGSDSANTAHYGSPTIPLLTLERIQNVPIGMFVGLQDPFADPTDTRYVKEKLNTLTFYQEYNNVDHYSFGIGLDMSFMNDVLAQL